MIVYSKRLKDALNDLRPAFRDINVGLDQLTKKRAEIAPIFMKTYELWRRETRRPFIAFVHELDPSMPVERSEYRTHRSYRAAAYLKQLVEQPDTTTPRGRTPLFMLAVTIKSLLPFCGAQKDQEATIATLVHATQWRERDRTRLVARIRKARPIALPQLARLVKPEAIRASKAAVVAFEQRQQVA